MTGARALLSHPRLEGPDSKTWCGQVGIGEIVQAPVVAEDVCERMGNRVLGTGHVKAGQEEDAGGRLG